MNNAELADRIATSHEMSKAEARRLVDAVLAAIVDAAKGGDEVALSGFGRFKVTERAARQGRNPQTGESIEIAASRKLGFAPAKPVRDALNPPAPAKKAPAKSAAKGKKA
jgi:DNA-binding protein HU-beta